MKDSGFLRVAAAVPQVKVGRAMENAEEILRMAGDASKQGVLAIFAMTTIDMGEYSGGSGGFVRKENLFFPKRQMKLKVTEKCGIFVIAEILVLRQLLRRLFEQKRGYFGSGLKGKSSCGGEDYF